MKRITVIIVLLCGVAVASGGGDYILRSLLYDGGMSKERVDSVLCLPRSLYDVITADEDNPVILPTDLLMFSPEGEWLLILHIEDTLRVSKFRLGGEREKK